MSDSALTRFEQGDTVRRSVLGSEHVDRSARMSGPLQALQQLVTEYAWGSVWTREGLDRRTRSLITIAMLTALNRPHELRLHADGAFRNGCTPEQVMEVVLHSAVYCGVPAAIDAARIVEEVCAANKERTEP